MWHAFFGLFACLDFGHSPLFLFLSLSWVLSLYEVSSSSLYMKTLLFQIFFKCLKEIQGGEIWVVFG
jgi:hypothetical protein